MSIHQQSVIQGSPRLRHVPTEGRMEEVVTERRAATLSTPPLPACVAAPVHTARQSHHALEQTQTVFSSCLLLLQGAAFTKAGCISARRHFGIGATASINIILMTCSENTGIWEQDPPPSLLASSFSTTASKNAC